MIRNMMLMLVVLLGLPIGSSADVQCVTLNICGGGSGSGGSGGGSSQATEDPPFHFATAPSPDILGSGPVLRILGLDGLAAEYVGALEAGVLRGNMPAQITTAQDGIPFYIEGGNAVPGSSVNGAAYGADLTIAAGSAARRTTGNADGGNLFLKGGGKVGIGTVGNVTINNATNISMTASSVWSMYSADTATIQTQNGLLLSGPVTASSGFNFYGYPAAPDLTCNASTHRMFRYMTDPGAADVLKVCMKKADDTYVWVAIATAP